MDGIPDVQILKLLEIAIDLNASTDFLLDPDLRSGFTDAQIDSAAYIFGEAHRMLSRVRVIRPLGAKPRSTDSTMEILHAIQQHERSDSPNYTAKVDHIQERLDCYDHIAEVAHAMVVEPDSEVGDNNTSAPQQLQAREPDDTKIVEDRQNNQRPQIALSEEEEEEEYLGELGKALKEALHELGEEEDEWGDPLKTDPPLDPWDLHYRSRHGSHKGTPHDFPLGGE